MKGHLNQKPSEGDRIAVLVKQLSNAEAALQAEVSGQVDSVILGDGRTYLLNAARRALDESLEAKAQLVAIVESSADAIIGLDVEGRITTWNKSAERIFGYSAQEMIGEPILRLIPDDLHFEEAQILDLVALGNPEPSYETSRRRKDGQLINVSITFSPIKNLAGAIIGTSKVVRDITERTRADSRLRSNENLIRIAGHIARLGGWSLDIESSKVTWSDEVCAIHDLPAGTSPRLEEAIGHYAPEWREMISASVRDCLHAGTPYDIELEIVTVKGRRSWVRAIGVPTHDAKGVISGIQGAFQDINDRKLAELEIKRTNRALQMLSRCNEALIRTEDEEALLKQICRLAVETGGYKMAWVGYAEHDAAKSIIPVAQMGDTDGYISKIKFSWSDDSEFGQSPACLAVRTRQVVTINDASKETESKQWPRVFVAAGFKSVISLPLLSKDQILGVIVLYSNEISNFGREEVKLLQELADDLAFGITNARARVAKVKSDTRVQEQAALLDKAQDAILVTDLDDRVIYWNKSAERLYGWEKSEAIGKTIESLIHPDVGGTGPAKRETLKKGEWTGELRNKAKDGRTIIVESRWSLVRDLDGEPSLFMSINTDITERKKIDEQFLRAQRVESIGTLASGIAHDLNNVLSPILLSVGLLSTTARDPDERRVLKTIEISAMRGAEMVKQVLAFARGVEGHKIPTPPKALIGDVTLVVRETFPKSIELRTDIEKDVWPIMGDPTQLHQVLLNLCVNARDAMPSGGTLTVTAGNIVVDEQFVQMNRGGTIGPHVLIQVRDTGTGIPPEIRERIFDPFFTTKAIGKGTGLGLSTVTTIVKSHNGFIHVESAPGKGTLLKLYFPAEDMGSDTPSKDPAQDIQRGNGECILVVDDEASVRVITQHTLEAFGYRVVLAENGAEGVAAYAKHKDEIALVITDLMMPVMDGPAMIHALVSLNPAVRVIAASGLGANGSVAKLVDRGISHFLPKPFSAHTLLSTVHRTLSE
jgi:PAS domain S-box-containing protein